MVMIKNDEQLIRGFLHDNRREVADNGFSRRVMRRLPIRPQMVSDLLTAVCMLLSCILFFTFDGPHLIQASLQELFQHSDWNAITNINLRTWSALPIVMTVWGIRKALSLSE